jgi:hypothetical protein
MTTTTTIPIFFVITRKLKKEREREVDVTAQCLKKYTGFYLMEILTTLAVWVFSPNLGFDGKQI